MFKLNTLFFVASFTLLLTTPLLFLFTPEVSPPEHLDDTQPDPFDDPVFLRIAIQNYISKKIQSYDQCHGSVSRHGYTGAKPKIAFLFLTNKDPDLAPIWTKFFDSHEDLYRAYFNRRMTAESPGGEFKNHFTGSKRTLMSSLILLSAARELLMLAINDPLNHYFVFVSQPCTPLHSFPYVYETLFRRSTESTRSSSRLKFMKVLYKEDRLWDRYIVRAKKNVTLPEIPFKRFRAGSQLFVLTQDHPSMVIEDREFWQKFRLPCLDVDTCYPEEHYFPMCPRVNRTGRILPEFYPDPTRLMRVSNSTSSDFFARPIFPDCLPALMEMADSVTMPRLIPVVHRSVIMECREEWFMLRLKELGWL